MSGGRNIFVAHLGKVGISVGISRMYEVLHARFTIGFLNFKKIIARTLIGDERENLLVFTWYNTCVKNT